ncbi:Probable E3 ubiquitin-protein ligase HERC6 [Linum perenne]
MGQLGHTSLQSGDKELLPRRVVSLDGIVIKDVACVSEKGALYAWGGGQAGQLGLGPQTTSFSFIPSDSESFLRNIPVLVVPDGVKHVACGHSHTLASLKDGRIHGWGYNSYGQAANEKSTYAWYPSPVDWCVRERTFSWWLQFSDYQLLVVFLFYKEEWLRGFRIAGA